MAFRTFKDLGWRLRGPRHLLPYWLSVARNAPLDQQIRELPRYMARKLRWVDLSDIQLSTDVREWRHPGDGFAIAGDWDKVHVTNRPSIFQESQGATIKDDIHETVRALFLRNEDYRSTAQYNYMLRAVRHNRFDLAYGCKSEEEVDAYFSRLIQAYEAMRKQGYLTQAALNGSAADEIKLYITRQGDWCLGNGGNHRIRFAELLGMKSVPVFMAGAHYSFIHRTCIERKKPPRAAMLQWFRDYSSDSP